jgi:hypothetical protein
MLRLFFAKRTRKCWGEQVAKRKRLGFGCYELMPYELIPIQRGRDEVFRSLRLERGLLHANYFAEAAQIHLRPVQIRQPDDVFDGAA